VLICWHYCVALGKCCLCSGRYVECFALQHHTATYCNRALHGNTLQHAAAHCHILPRTPTHCNRLQQVATSCNTLAFSVRSVCACFSSLTHSIMSKAPLIIYTYINTTALFWRHGTTCCCSTYDYLRPIQCMPIHTRYIYNIYIYMYTYTNNLPLLDVCLHTTLPMYAYIHIYIYVYITV